MSSGERVSLMGRVLILVAKRRPTLFEVYISGSGQCFLVDEGE